MICLGRVAGLLQGLGSSVTPTVILDAANRVLMPKQVIAMRTTWEHAKLEILKFIKIRITLL